MANKRTTNQNRDTDDTYFVDYFWWGVPAGWSDVDLYDYNNNYMLDDNEIADIVSDNIFDDPYITWSDTRNIKVSVDDGVVTLSGSVRNPRSKPAAYNDAYWSTGVIDVINDIQVKQHQRKQQTNEQRKSHGKSHQSHMVH